MNVTFGDGTRQEYEDQPFARGGQGVLHRSRDGHHVVKLYTQVAAQQARARAEQVDKIIGEYNVVGRDPYWDELYTWPDKRVRSPGPGVRMRYVEGLTRMDYYFYKQAYQHLPPERKGWWIGRVACAIKLARAVGRFSNRGLCHSDLSDKNLMVDPFSGRLTILDCDSLVVPEVLPPAVDGTADYMAPEIVAGHAHPTTLTDLHALAVLLYRWLLFRHPLRGPKHHANDPDADERLMLGERALYIEHPGDHSNRPRRLQFTADEMLTPRLADLFREAFVDGLHAPYKRPVPSRWEEALIELFDAVVPCPNGACEVKFFVAHDARPLRCPLCHTYADFPARIPFLKLHAPLAGSDTASGTFYGNEGRYPRYVVGWPERPLYAWHADPAIHPVPDATGAPPDTRPRAIVRYDASDSAWYLENLALTGLRATLGASGRASGALASDAAWVDVPRGARVELRHGASLLLGPEGRGRMAFVELRRVTS